jgi:hypothetical protein
MHSLAFTYDFKYDDDIVFFAHSFPYTVTKLSNFLDSIDQK